MTPRLWEDHLNHSGCTDVMAERDRSDHALTVLLVQVREELKNEQYVPRHRSITVQPARPWNAERIRELRVGLDYTQKEIAAMVGVTAQAWALWESGTNRPTHTCIRRLIELERGERS